jgi:hypothetical protein
MDRLRARGWLRKVADLCNLFHFTHWDSAIADATPRVDWVTQLFFSAIAVCVGIALLSQSLELLLSQPIVTTITVPNPAPDAIAALFADESVTGLSCPCSSATAPLATTTSWVAPADNFCVNLLTAADNFGSDAAATEALINALVDPRNILCIAEVDKGPFIANVAALLRRADVFPEDSNFDNVAQEFAAKLESALCTAAFGTAGFQATFADESKLPNGNFLNPLKPTTTMLNAQCLDDVPCDPNCDTDIAPPYNVLGPLAAAYGNGVTFIQMQQTRLRRLIDASIDTCGTLASLRAGFLRDVAVLPLVTPLALRPDDLRQQAEALFFGLLEQVGAETATLVPSSSGSDPIVPLTEIVDRSLLWHLNLGNRFGSLSLRPDQNYDTTVNFPFSSRLPFVRTDYVVRGSSFYYLLSERVVTPGVEEPVFPFAAGEVNVRVNTPTPRALPYYQVRDGSPWVFGHAPPGFDPLSANGSVPVGDDLLTLLDACAEGRRVTADVLNMRGISIDDDNANPTTWSDLNSLDPNFASLFCGTGGWSPGTGDTPLNARSPALPPILSTPLTCPPLFKWFASLRANSSYARATSGARASIGEFLELFPSGTIPDIEAMTAPQIAFLDRSALGDITERRALLRTLFFNDSRPVFTHDALAHYRACAPRACTYSTSKDPGLEDIALSIVGTMGGNVYAVVAVLSFVGWYASFLRQELCGRSTAALGADRSENSRKAEEVAGTNPLSWG